MPKKKSDKEYEDFTKELQLADLSREGIRKQLFDIFLHEKAGHREGDITHATRYRYFVETLADGRRIFLKRPARLNKGIDIEIWVERFEGMKDDMPSYKDILKDLKAKKEENQEDYSKLVGAIKAVYECKSPDDILKKCSFTFNGGLSPELILKVAKWQFIEQDLTYWSWEGRNMLMRGILSV